jgi:hypothetical protein
MDLTETETLIDELLKKKILKIIKGDYKFEYVGAIIYKDIFIMCQPKYVKERLDKEQIVQILKLLRLYSNRENLSKDELETLGTNPLDSSSKLSLAYFILEDYSFNNLYTKEIKVIESDGDGEIDWDYTIDQADMILSNGQPFYLNMYTNRKIYDSNDLLTLLHKHVVYSCNEYIHKSGIGEYLMMSKIDVDNVGEINLALDEIIYIIDQELNIQYNDIKKLTLQAMKSYFLADYNKGIDSNIDFFGSRYFHIVWEKVCSFVLNNQYEKYKKYIEKPTWIFGDKQYNSDRLKPDIIHISAENNVFVIADAKYYNLKYKNGLENNPGIGDITKQYLYQLALKPKIEDEGYLDTKNVLLFPTEKNEIKIIGSVSLDFLNNVQLKKIDVYQVPARDFYQRYIVGDQSNKIVSFIEN